MQPTGALGYFVGVVKGMKAYCDGFAKVAGTIPALKAYVEGHDIAGVKADGQQLTVELERPAGDFPNILAMTFASPMPVESLSYLPDSPEFRQNFLSDGPYKIAKYVADKQIELVRNPAWKAESDPLRKAHVDAISITMGSDEGPVQQQLEAGTADMSWDTSVPTANVPQLLARKDPRLVLGETGRTDPYVVINTQSPNQGGALKKLQVRQALNYAVNKKNVIQVLGGPELNQPLGQVLTPHGPRLPAVRRLPDAGQRGRPGEGQAAAGPGRLPGRPRPRLPLPQPRQGPGDRDDAAGRPRQGRHPARAQAGPAGRLLHPAPHQARGDEGR